MKVLLDTNALIRHMQDTLPPKVERLLTKSTTEILVSIVTPWEIALKPVLRKAGLSSQRVKAHLELLGARLLSVTWDHTERVAHLPAHHHEAFDHMIIAQALVENCSIISSDTRFPQYATEGLKVLWD